MLEVKLSMVGKRPLLMHNIRLADPLDEYARKLKELSSKRGKTDAAYADMATVEYLGGLYHDEELGPYIPGEWAFASLVGGARLSKQGRQVERGVILGEFGYKNPIIYDGPRDLESLEKDLNFRDRRMATVARARVARTRPCFPRWAVEIPLYVDEEVINFDALADIAVRSGKFVGIGDHRPFFGRYEAAVEKVKE